MTDPLGDNERRQPDTSRSVPITRLDASGVTEASDEVVVEHQLTIVVNDRVVASQLCLASDLELLVYGYLWSEGIIQDVNDVESLDLDASTVTVRVNVNSAAISQARSLPAGFRVSAADILALMGELETVSSLHAATSGVHSALLARGREVLFSYDDIGRHNALDKVLGRALLDGIDLADKILLSSGRLPTEQIRKAVRTGAPILVSRARPTDAAIDLAERYYLTLVGYVRQGAMHIYAHPERVVS